MTQQDDFYCGVSVTSARLRLKQKGKAPEILYLNNKRKNEL